MKLTCCLFIVFLGKEITAATLRKPPAFSTPVYTDAYLPATLQVIFHAVEQLRYLQMEEAQQENTTSLVPTTSSHRPGYHHPYSSSDTKEEAPTTELMNEDKIYDKSLGFEQVTPVINHETPEQNQETPEMNYATPEMNYEAPEVAPMMSESQNNTETINQGSISLPTVSAKSTVAMNNECTTASGAKNKNKKPTIDSVVQEVYDIVKPPLKPSTIQFDMDTTEKSENVDEEEEEIRYYALTNISTEKSLMLEY